MIKRSDREARLRYRTSLRAFESAIAPASGALKLTFDNTNLHFTKMTKPIGFFCNYTPGDGGLLGEMEESWGSTFEALNKSERLWMLASLTGAMTAARSDNYNPYEVSDAIVPAIERFHELSFYEQMALAEALVSQIRTIR